MLVLLLISVAFVLTGRFFNKERFYIFLRLPYHVKGGEVASAYNPARVAFNHDYFNGLGAILAITLGIYWLHSYDREIMAPDYEGPLSFLRIALVVLVFLLVKNMLSALVGFVFSSQEKIIVAQNRGFAYLAWVLVPLLPLLLLAFYLPFGNQVFFYMIYGILVAGYLYSTLQAMAEIWKLPAPAYYKILYLCALEIIPLLFLLKWFKSL